MATAATVTDCRREAQGTTVPKAQGTAAAADASSSHWSSGYWTVRQLRALGAPTAEPWQWQHDKSHA